LHALGQFDEAQQYQEIAQSIDAQGSAMYQYATATDGQGASEELIHL